MGDGNDGAFVCRNASYKIRDRTVQVTRNHRALGVLEDNTVTWFWIGDHDESERFYS